MNDDITFKRIKFEYSDVDKDIIEEIYYSCGFDYNETIQRLNVLVGSKVAIIAPKEKEKDYFFKNEDLILGPPLSKEKKSSREKEILCEMFPQFNHYIPKLYDCTNENLKESLEILLLLSTGKKEEKLALSESLDDLDLKELAEEEEEDEDEDEDENELEGENQEDEGESEESSNLYEKYQNDLMIIIEMFPDLEIQEISKVYDHNNQNLELSVEELMSLLFIKESENSRRHTESIPKKKKKKNSKKKTGNKVNKEDKIKLIRGFWLEKNKKQMKKPKMIVAKTKFKRRRRKQVKTVFSKIDLTQLIKLTMPFGIDEKQVLKVYNKCGRDGNKTLEAIKKMYRAKKKRKNKKLHNKNIGFERVKRYDKKFDDLMEKIDNLKMEMEKCYKKSVNEYLKGNEEGSKKLKEKGKGFKEEIERIESNAREMRFEWSNYYNTNYNKIDLHGLLVNESLGVIKEHFDICRKNGVDKVEVITGKGKHSKKGAKIKPAVKKFLDLNDYKYSSNRNNGGFFVKLLS